MVFYEFAQVSVQEEFWNRIWNTWDCRKQSYDKFSSLWQEMSYFKESESRRLSWAWYPIYLYIIESDERSHYVDYWRRPNM